MSLPKLNAPIYELILPSTGKPIKYRPFLVKEHKILLMLKQSSDDEIVKIIQDVIDACTFKALNVNELPSFDLEYIFIKLREKSIGETTDLLINCDCGNQVPYKMNLSTLQVKKTPSHDNKIMINDTVGIEMRYPKFKDTISVFMNNEEERVMDLITDSVKAIYTTDGTYTEIDVDNKKELLEFINSMTKEQFDKVEHFFMTMPKLVHDIEVTCDKCNGVTKTSLEGLQNFFA